ncbi:undecaprenyl-phosphate glucose phosphotransferase, partial [Salmonella enterica subsp. enterica serovar Typhi]|nr:undecaprenyl-phosphate glucose phosphotransferase [Salmonella enterica subsp. enterica serovar Typhi]
MIRKNQRFLTQLYILTDFVFIQISFLLAWWVKFESGLIAYEQPLPVEIYAFWSVVYGAIAVFVGILISLYTPKRKKRFADEVWKIIQVHVASLFLLFGLMFFFKQVDISRVYLAFYMILNLLLIMFYRYFLKNSLKQLRKKGYNKQFVLILGAGTLGQRFHNNLKQYPELGYEIVGFLDDHKVWDGIEATRYKPVLGRIDQLESVLQDKLIDEVVLALPLEAHHRYARIISICEKVGVRTLIIPDFFDYLPARPYFDNFAGMPMINVRDIPLDLTGNRVAK